MNLRCFVGVWLVYSVQFNNSLEFEKERLSKGQLCSDSTIIKYTTPFKVWAHPLRLVLPLDLSQFLKDTSFSIYPALLFSDNMHFICGMNSDKIYKGCKPTWAGEIGELLNDALSESVDDAREKKKKKRFWDQWHWGFIHVMRSLQKLGHEVMSTMFRGRAVGGIYWLTGFFWNTAFRRSSCQGLCSATIHLCPDATHSRVLLPSDTTSAGWEETAHSPSRHYASTQIHTQSLSDINHLSRGALLCHPGTDDVFHPFFINTSSRKAEGWKKKKGRMSANTRVHAIIHTVEWEN